MIEIDDLALPALPRELMGLIDGPPPTYQRLYRLVLDGRLPAVQVNGRYRVARADLTTIITMMDLRAKAAEPEQSSRKSKDALASE